VQLFADIGIAAEHLQSGIWFYSGLSALACGALLFSFCCFACLSRTLQVAGWLLVGWIPA
jgi:hypothetical protein